MRRAQLLEPHDKPLDIRGGERREMVPERGPAELPRSPAEGVEEWEEQRRVVISAFAKQRDGSGGVYEEIFSQMWVSSQLGRECGVGSVVGLESTRPRIAKQCEDVFAGTLDLVLFGDAEEASKVGERLDRKHLHVYTPVKKAPIDLFKGTSFKWRDNDLHPSVNDIQQSLHILALILHGEMHHVPELISRAPNKVSKHC